VPPEQTGEATGFNALVRSVGASVGTQVTATILTGSIAAGALLPSSSGYTTAFVVSAAVAAVAALAAVAIPRASLHPHAHAPALEEMGAASPLGDPALADQP
jgi:sugar phosphate permease